MYTRKSHEWIAATLLAGALALPAFAQPGKIDAYIRSEMKAQKIPGLALAIVQDGEVVKAQGYGLANVELDVPVKPETIFQSGSVGKQFTATLAMMLVEEGRLRLDDPIGKYLPGSPKSWRGITVRHLLSHTGGISNGIYDQIDLRKDYTEDELFREIAALPLDFEPGTRWSYSNPGYVLLGILIHKVTGKFYGDLLREKIFAPLGMKTARIISEADIVPNRADGYRLVDGELKNQDWVSPMLNTTADGALYLTILDMVRWDAGLDSGKLLKRLSLDLMWTKVRLADGKTAPYGFGWSLDEVNGHPIVEHSGAWQGFRAAIARYPEDRLTVVVFVNLDAADPDEIAHEVAALVGDELRAE